MSSEILQCRWLVLAQFRGEGSRKPRRTGTSHLVENTGKKFFFLSFNDWTLWRHCSGFGVHRVASAPADYTPRSSRTRREFISRLLVSSSHRPGHRPDVHRRWRSSRGRRWSKQERVWRIRSNPLRTDQGLQFDVVGTSYGFLCVSATSFRRTEESDTVFSRNQRLLPTTVVWVILG